MTSAATRHVHGPVPSRRLGRSLGIDLVPFKTCTYDCIYSANWADDLQDVEDEGVRPRRGGSGRTGAQPRVRAAPRLHRAGRVGEPTLHSGIGEVIDGIRTTDAHSGCRTHQWIDALVARGESGAGTGRSDAALAGCGEPADVPGWTVPIRTSRSNAW